MKLLLISSWQKLGKKIDARKGKIRQLNEAKRISRLGKAEAKKILIVVELKKQSGFDKWSVVKKLQSSFPMTYL
jgi:hypothetical protein